MIEKIALALLILTAVKTYGSDIPDAIQNSLNALGNLVDTQLENITTAKVQQLVTSLNSYILMQGREVASALQEKAAAEERLSTAQTSSKPDNKAIRALLDEISQLRAQYEAEKKLLDIDNELLGKAKALETNVNNKNYDGITKNLADIKTYLEAIVQEGTPGQYNIDGIKDPRIAAEQKLETEIQNKLKEAKATGIDAKGLYTEFVDNAQNISGSYFNEKNLADLNAKFKALFTKFDAESNLYKFISKTLEQNPNLRSKFPNLDLTAKNQELTALSTKIARLENIQKTLQVKLGELAKFPATRSQLEQWWDNFRDNFLSPIIGKSERGKLLDELKGLSLQLSFKNLEQFSESVLNTITSKLINFKSRFGDAFLRGKAIYGDKLNGEFVIEEQAGNEFKYYNENKVEIDKPVNFDSFTKIGGA